MPSLASILLHHKGVIFRWPSSIKVLEIFKYQEVEYVVRFSEQQTFCVTLSTEGNGEINLLSILSFKY